MTESLIRNSILEKLQQPGCPEFLDPSHLDKIFLAILPVFQKQIDNRVVQIVHATTVSGTDTSLSHRANRIKAEDCLKKALGTYLFVSKKWMSKSSLSFYLLKSLNNFTAQEFNNNTTYSKVNKFICPACKEFGMKTSLLEMSDGVLYCKTCDEAINHVGNVIVQNKIRLSSLFVRHSKKGAKCPRCARFVPFSFKFEDGSLKCPYEMCGVDCGNAVKINHPIGSFKLDSHSFDAVLKDKTGHARPNLHEVLKDKRAKSIEMSVGDLDTIKKTITSIQDIIVNQKAINGKTRSSPNKSIMYDSILNVVEKYPFEMINFLVKRNKADLPMQALIFQEFSKNMLDILPVEFMCHNKTIRISSPLDPRLKLFTGIHSFVGTIDKSLNVKKPTILLKNREEDFLPNKSLHQYSFMGSIRRILNENCEDVSEDVDVYSFVNIKFKPSSRIIPGTKVYTEYYSIPSHYSMQSMAHLRRIMKRIHHSCTAKKL